MEDPNIVTQLLEKIADLDINSPDFDNNFQDFVEDKELNKFQQ